MTKDTFLPIAAFILDPRKSAVDLDRELARMKTDELEKRLGERKVIVFPKGIIEGQQMSDCKRCQGTGEIVTDWRVYLEDGHSDDEGVAECPDCDGAGEADDDETCCPGCGACPGFPKGWAK